MSLDDRQDAVSIGERRDVIVIPAQDVRLDP
jgi:hypothetical protein